MLEWLIENSDVSWSFLAGYVTSRAIRWLDERRHDRKTYPYQWSCPQCDTTMKTSDQTALKVLRSRHLGIHD